MAEDLAQTRAEGMEPPLSDHLRAVDQAIAQEIAERKDYAPRRHGRPILPLPKVVAEPHDPLGLVQARNAVYGAFVTRAACAQDLKRVIAKHLNGKQLDDDMQQFLDETCGKISRIVCGDDKQPDNPRDIAGYATLVAERLEGRVI